MNEAYMHYANAGCLIYAARSINQDVLTTSAFLSEGKKKDIITDKIEYGLTEMNTYIPLFREFVIFLYNGAFVSDLSDLTHYNMNTVAMNHWQ